MFGDKENYPRFFRTIPEIKQFFDGYSEVLKKMNWNRVAVIYYDDDFTLNVCVVLCYYTLSMLHVSC